MNLPTENRKLMILEIAKNINNYTDCDVIYDAIKETENANNKDDLIASVKYLITAIAYRRKETKGIKLLLNELI